MDIEALQKLVDAEVQRFVGAQPAGPFTASDAQTLTAQLLAIIDKHSTRRVGLWVRGVTMADVRASVSITVRYPSPPPRPVYVLGIYEEHATYDTRATMDPARLPAMIDALATGNTLWADEAKATLAVALAKPLTELAGRAPIHLHAGWGGAVLYVMQLEENAQ